MFKETKGYCEAQQEVHTRAFGMRGKGGGCILKKVLQKAETHFEEPVAICEEAGYG